MASNISLNLGPASTVLTFGELLLRLSPQGGLRIEQASAFDARYGGAEANVAFSLAYQGDRAAYLTVVPPNRIGDQALRTLVSVGVDVSRVLHQGDRLGAYFFEVGGSDRSNSVVYDRKYSAISLAQAEDFDWDAILQGVDAFFFSGVTPAVSPELAKACEQALVACRQRGVVTVCDLNYRGKLWSVEDATATMRRLLPYVDVCVANDEDAPSCLGISHGSGSLATGIDEKESFALIAEDICRDFGVKVVASVIRNIRSVEDSDWMAMVYADGKASYSRVHRVHVLEGVAAGDAFCAGLIHALLAGMDADEAAEYAIAASVLKLTIRGDLNWVSAEEIAAVAGTGSGLRVAR